MLFTSFPLCAHVLAHTHAHKYKFVYSHVVLCTKTDSKHNRGDVHAHPNLLGLFFFYLCREVHNDNYSLGQHSWINQISHSHTHTHPEVPGGAVVCADWCAVLEQPSVRKWSVQLLFYIKTSWGSSEQHWEMCRANKNSSKTDKESERLRTYWGCN